MTKQAFWLNGGVRISQDVENQNQQKRRKISLPDKITFLPDNYVQNSIAIVSLPDKAQSESMYTLKLCEGVLDWCFDTSYIIGATIAYKST